MANTGLSSLAADLRKLVDGSTVDQFRHVAGKAAKEAAADAAKADVGGDMAMSNFRKGNVKLGSGYELEGAEMVILGLKPAGAWSLASKGRKRSGPILPKKRRAVRTPEGLRSRSRYGPSKGLGTIEDAEKRIETDVFKAVDKAVAQRVGGF